ncbi:hypothetical protein B4923_08760 [Brenneria roseae subsp. americana]|uniref:Uncharacterized protein n=1 Tax=Brenneria roseae subsp. americana TaxID=1508507 RepID=A0A2U1TV79_9GAMM|nr:hypothetical protein B4923_08760 [Brenneria roseae subsp. americana]
MVMIPVIFHVAGVLVALLGLLPGPLALSGRVQITDLKLTGFSTCPFLQPEIYVGMDALWFCAAPMMILSLWADSFLCPRHPNRGRDHPMMNCLPLTYFALEVTN